MLVLSYNLIGSERRMRIEKKSSIGNNVSIAANKRLNDGF